MITNRERELNKLRQRKRRARIKQELIKMLGGKCIICGSTLNLEFDHIDPSSKIIAISDAIASKSEQFIYNEIKKCQLLCKVCHIKKTKKHGDNIKKRLSDEDYEKICELYYEGNMTQNDIGKLFGISQKYVSSIVNKQIK